MTFERELRELLNRHSKENGSDTPDFILAEYLSECLRVYNLTMFKRENWYGRKLNFQKKVDEFVANIEQEEKEK